MARTTPLKIAILESGFSQIELAAALGIHDTLLNMFANGWRKPNAEQAKMIAKKLGKKTKDLFGETYK